MFGMKSDNDTESVSSNSSSDEEDSQSASSSSGDSDSSSSFNSDDEEQWAESIDHLYEMLLLEVLQREGHAQTGGSLPSSTQATSAQLLIPDSAQPWHDVVPSSPAQLSVPDPPQSTQDVPSSHPEQPVPDSQQQMEEIVPSSPPQPTIPDPPQPMQVEPSPPPQGMLSDEDDPPPALNVRETSYLSLTANRTFYNRRFKISGFVFFVGIHTRPFVEDRGAAFTEVLLELTRAFTTDFLPDDYVQLIFKSGDLDRDFVLPLVKVRNFDRRVAEEQFAGILTSNTEVDVGRGDFRIAVYHTRVLTVAEGSQQSTERLWNSF